jgi:two-component system LytT family sensor kinase
MSKAKITSQAIGHYPKARWGIIFAFWTFAGLFMASEDYISYLLGEVSTNWYKHFLPQLSFAYLWALLTPFLLWLARRFHIERGYRVRNFLLHVFLSATFSTLTIVGIHSMYLYLFHINFSYNTLLRNINGNLHYYGLIYWLILLVTHAFDYYNRFREAELRESKLQTQLAQAQLQALKMQLHPHFLFNTLHSISALQRKDLVAANHMIVRLGDFLRLTLDNSGAQDVPLQKELEFLGCYLEIQRIRFQDRLSVNIDVDPKALDAQVPNLILQPIVENAIKHGIAPYTTPGHIDIRAHCNNGLLQLQVRDNGQGLCASDCSGSAMREGLGLANTKARLSKLYDTAYRFDLTNAPEGGLLVSLEIPFKQWLFPSAQGEEVSRNGKHTNTSINH